MNAFKFGYLSKFKGKFGLFFKFLRIEISKLEINALNVERLEFLRILKNFGREFQFFLSSILLKLQILKFLKFFKYSNLINTISKRLNFKALIILGVENFQFSNFQNLKILP